MPMGSHQSAVNKSDVWLTPPHILRALGEFDLDPCAARFVLRVVEFGR